MKKKNLHKAKPPTPIAQRANLTNMATIWCDFHTQENCTSRTTVTTPDSSTELTAPDSSTEVTIPDSSTELPTFTTGQIVVVSVLGGICCILVFIFAYKRCRAYQKRVEEALHREKIRDAVRAKIAEMEGLADLDTMKWVTEEPKTCTSVRWGDVMEIGPADERPTLRVCYHPIYSTDDTEIKMFDMTYDEIFGSSFSHKRPTSVPSMGSFTFLFNRPSSEVDAFFYNQNLKDLSVLSDEGSSYSTPRLNRFTFSESKQESTRKIYICCNFCRKSKTIDA